MRVLGANAFLSIVCAVLMVMSVTVCPAVAMATGSEQTDTARARYTEEFEVLMKSGSVNLTSLSALSAFKDEGVQGIDVTVGGGRDPSPSSRLAGGAPVSLADAASAGARAIDGESRVVPLNQATTIHEGLFTFSTAQEAAALVARAAADDQYGDFVYNMSQMGYDLTTMTTQPYETTVSLEKQPTVDAKRMVAAGLRRSSENPNVLVAQGVVTQFAFTNRTTDDTVEVIATQPTDAKGNAVGPVTLCISRPDTAEKVVVVVLTAGAAGLIVGLITAYLLGGPAVITEAAALLGGAAAVCFGLSATGVGVVVGIAVAVVVAVVLVYYCFSADDTAALFLTTYTESPHYLAVSDGTVVWDNGTVTFPLDPTTPPPPGSDWVQATRKAAINTNGELWMLNAKGTAWVKHPTAQRYLTIAQSDKWVTAVAVNDKGQTTLEIPTGKDQPAEDSAIRKDLQTLNAGKNPHADNKVITPPVPGWKSFVPGTDYGLALTTDGRVFGVGTAKDNQFSLKGRYTKIATATQAGWFENDRYSLGIRVDDGSIDFAGDDPNHIKDDIKKAHLDHVIDIAAGPDRALALTSHGGIKISGKDNWVGDTPPPQQHRDGPYTSVSASIRPSGKCVFLASVETGTDTFIPSNEPAWSPTPENWVFVETAVNASNLSSTEKAFVISQLHLINDNGGRRKGEVSPEVRQWVERIAMECILIYYRIDLPPDGGSNRGKRWSGCFSYCVDGTHNNLAEIAGQKMGLSDTSTHILNEHGHKTHAAPQWW
jgi:hypothetical protein